MKRLLLSAICLVAILFAFAPACFAGDLPDTPTAYAASDYALYASKIAVGGAHIAVVKPDGTVIAWGDDTYGQTDVPAELTNVRAVAAGDRHTLALKNDGHVVGWGKLVTNIGAEVEMEDYSDLPAEVDAVQGHIELIAAGSYMSAVVTDDNRFIVWGYNTDNLERTWSWGNTGNLVALAINDNGFVVLDEYGNIQTAGNVDCTGNVPADLDGNVVAVAAGTDHWLALKTDGKVAVWGNGSQLRFCKNISDASDVRAIGAGIKSASALMDDGSVKVWGIISSMSSYKYDGYEVISGSEIIKAFSCDVIPYDLSNNSTVCALRGDGTLHVLTGSDLPQKNLPAGLNLLYSADLSNLEVSGYALNPSFDADTTAYTVSVPNGVTSVDVTARTVDDDPVFLEIDGNSAESGAPLTVDNLTVGNNTVEIKVTTGNGATVKNYTLTINRAKSNNDNLKDLTVASVVYGVYEYYTLTPDFDPSIFNYAVNVPNEITGVAVTATTADVNATLQINGTDAASSVAQMVYGLNEGVNPIIMKVTAEDDSTTKNYTIAVNRASSGGTGQSPPAVTADTSNNTVGQPVSLTFTDDADWRAAITGISVDGSVLASSRYSVAAGSITINAGVFTGAGNYSIAVVATGYDDATVTQYINKAVPENKFDIGNVQLLNPSNNQEISSVKGQEGYRVQARIDNNDQAATGGLVIIQVRHGAGATAEGGGKVLNCVGVASDISETGSVVSSDYTLPSGLSGKAYIDVFVWDGWTEQAPLADPNHGKSFTVNK